MKYTKKSFIELAITYNVLQFGQFTLKSGRSSPYFFNLGAFNDGLSIKHLGQFYARKILDEALSFDHLFGPAYKGIPLATTTAIALNEHGINTTVSFNRKEAKDHGEGGNLVGAKLHGKTLVLDDVITAGTAFREAKNIIEATGAHVNHLLIALNRCESDSTGKNALEQIRDQGISVYSIIDIFDVIEYLHEQKRFDEAHLIEAHLKTIL